MSRIYVVEDDENIREIEEYALRNAGFDTIGYACAADFYQGLTEKLPDLVILDLMLPDEDGLSILNKLRKKKETDQIPVIIITAKSTELDKVRGLDQGADDYVTKPFGVMELIARRSIIDYADHRKKENLRSKSIELDTSEVFGLRF